MLYWLKYVLVPLICFFSLQHFPVVSSIGGIDITTYWHCTDIEIDIEKDKDNYKDLTNNKEQ